jgi:predicted RNA-binding Zn-ribbon protein involved in translation (DUF1610 family)
LAQAFIAATGQWWKAAVIGVTSVLSVACFSIAMRLAQATPTVGVLALLGLAVGLAIVAFVVGLSIKCPHCGTRLTWRLLTTDAFDKEVKWEEMTACPACGFVPPAKS